MKQNKLFDPLHIFRFCTDAVVLDANAIPHLIKQFRRCVLICHEKVAINNVIAIESSLTDCRGGIMHRYTPAI
jgi:hypothetical protein